MGWQYYKVETNTNELITGADIKRTCNEYRINIYQTPCYCLNCSYVDPSDDCHKTHEGTSEDNLVNALSQEFCGNRDPTQCPSGILDDVFTYKYNWNNGACGIRTNGQTGWCYESSSSSKKYILCARKTGKNILNI